MRESQSKKIKVERYDGMSAVRLTGKRMLPGWCRRAAWSIAHGQHNNELVKDEGAYGGDRAVLQRDTGHPSPLNANYGLCNGPGVDQDGNTISNLCSYSKQDSTEGAESVRHMGTDLHRLARTVFAAAKKAGVCSPPQLSSRESLPRYRCAIMMETTRPTPTCTPTRASRSTRTASRPDRLIRHTLAAAP